MTSLLIAGGFLTALSTTVLKGDNINDILANTGFFDTLTAAVADELSGEKFGLSADAISAIIPDDIMSETIDKITDSIVNDTPFNISYIYDDCYDIAQTTSDKLIDEAFDMIDDNSVFDAKMLSSLPAVAEFEEDYGVDVTSEVENTMMSTFGTTSVDVSLLGTDEVKKQVSDTVTDTVFTVINEAFNEYSAIVNEIANGAIHKANDEYNIKDVLENFNTSLKYLHPGIIVVYIVVIVIFIIQLIMYLKKPSGAFKNLSVCTFITAAVMFASCGFLEFASDIIAKELNSFNSVQNIIKDFIETNLNAVKGSIITFGVICCVIGVVAAVVAVVSKKVSRQ
jgi:hypothetical protein